jgi:hypothetical protein
MTQKGVQWEETKTDLDTVDWRGHSIHLKDVPALKNTKTGKIRLYPEQVSNAEIGFYAKQFGIEPRDVPLLLTLYAKPGAFKGGYVQTRYHLNKTLFYIWKELERVGLGDAFPRDQFEAMPRGPVPTDLKLDTERLQAKGLVSTSMYRWGKEQKQQSVVTELTPEGLEIAKRLWDSVGDPFKKTILLIKERIFPLNPKTIRDRVHREFPEYKKTYTELDTD